MATTPPTARERLIQVASRLFYAEGIHAVGIDRVIAEAGVAKATLYAHFACKEDLVAQYLERQSAWWAAAVEQRVADLGGAPPSGILAAFDVLAERVADPGYRGCPFINAAAEFPRPGPVQEQVGHHRKRVRDTFSKSIGALGEAPWLVDVLVALYDGAMASAYLDSDQGVVEPARRGAEVLLRAGSAARKPRSDRVAR